MDRDILTVHCAGDGDNTPLQFISAARLRYYRRVEVVAAVFSALALGALLTLLILAACWIRAG